MIASPNVRLFAILDVEVEGTGNTMNRKSKIFQSTVPVALTGLSFGLCPLFDDREDHHVEVEQHQPLRAFGNAGVMYMSSVTTTGASTFSAWPTGQLNPRFFGDDNE